MRLRLVKRDPAVLHKYLDGSLYILLQSATWQLTNHTLIFFRHETTIFLKFAILYVALNVTIRARTAFFICDTSNIRKTIIPAPIWVGIYKINALLIVSQLQLVQVTPLVKSVVARFVLAVSILKSGLRPWESSSSSSSKKCFDVLWHEHPQHPQFFGSSPRRHLLGCTALHLTRAHRPKASVPEIKAIATSDNKSKVGFIFRLWLGGWSFVFVLFLWRVLTLVSHRKKMCCNFSFGIR
jgi:hypothetical protein